MSSLIQAVRKNDVKEVKNILDINAKDANGDTALIFAVKKPIVNIDILKMLIHSGADLNAQNNDGATALIWATILNHKEVVKILIDAGADLNVRPSSTALIIAVAKNHREIAKMLIKAGAKKGGKVTRNKKTRSNIYQTLKRRIRRRRKRISSKVKVR